MIFAEEHAIENQEHVLVTGAAGFIGSHVCEALMARRWRVIALDNFDGYYSRETKQRNLDEVAARDPGGLFDVVEGDICDEAVVGSLFERNTLTGVIHLAARAGVRPSIEHPALYAKVNLEGTATLFEAARQSDSCARFVMASSSSVYGNCPTVPFSEDMDVNNPISPYAATKRACELMAHSHHYLYGLPMACLRFFTVFGPRQRPDLAILKFLRKISAGETIQMFGDGSSSRDYTFVADIVAGVLASYDRIPEFGYRVWNLGGNSPVTLREMIDTIGRVVGKEPVVEQLPMQPGDVDRTYADLTRSGAELGYAPTTAFEEGVRQQWDWLCAQ